METKIKFSRFQTLDCDGEGVQDITLNGEYVGEILRATGDFGGATRVIRSAYYEVELQWLSEVVSFSVPRGSGGYEARPGAARAAHKSAKDFARAEIKDMIAFCKAFTGAIK